MDSDGNRIFLNVSGTKYEVDVDIFKKFPNSRLAKLIFTSETCCLYFNRPASLFEFILSYYQTGELHIPGNVCPRAFQTELKFWEIDDRVMERCCIYKYMTFMDDMESRDKFYATTSSNKHNGFEGNTVSFYSRMRKKLWSVLDHKENSYIAKIYFGIAMIFVLLSIFSLALSTLSFFKEPLTTCELEEFMKVNDYDIPQFVIEFLDKLDCQSIPQGLLSEVMDGLYDYENYGETEYQYRDMNSTDLENENVMFDDKFPNKIKRLFKNITVPNKIKRYRIFHALDFAVTSFFTIELIFRICSCPNIKTYVTSVLNILEALVLMASYVHVILETHFAKLRYETKGLEILQYLQMLRVVRLFRIMQNVTAIKVLTHSVRTGYKDLIVLMLYMFIGIIVFANFTYFAEETENFPNIPQAWWWGMVTMTTVGYGDIAPKSVLGKLIASVCVLTGIVLMSLVIPLFVNTFVQLYQFARIQEKLKIQQKVRNSVSELTVETTFGDTATAMNLTTTPIGHAANGINVNKVLEV